MDDPRKAVAKTGLLLVALLCAASMAGAQWVYRVVSLPDSFIGADRPSVVAADRFSTKAYVAGTGGLPAVVGIDCATGDKVARVGFSEDVEQLLADPAVPLVYVVGRTRLAAISPRGDTFVANVGYGEGPGIAEIAATRLYIANSLYGSLLQLRAPDLHVEDTIAVSLTPVAMDYDFPHNKLYVAGAQGVVAAVTVPGNEVVAEIPVGSSPSCVLSAAGYNRVFVANRLGNSVSVINPYYDSVIATIPVGSGPVAMALSDPNRVVYVANRNAGFVSVVSCDSLVVVDVVPVPGPKSVAADGAGDYVYVGTANDGLYVIDARTNTVAAQLDIGAEVQQLAWQDSAGVVVAPSDKRGTAALVDTTMLADVQIASSFPRAGVLTRYRLLIAEERMNRVRVLWQGSLTPIGVIPVGEQPYALCWSRTSNKVYCACRGSGQVGVIDVGGDSLLGYVDVGNAPQSLAWDSVGNKVYCGNYGSTELTAIDCETDQVVARVEVGRGTRKVACSRLSRKVYVSCHDQATIYAVDTEADTIVATFGTSGNPWTLAIDQEHNVIYAPTSWGMPIICGHGDTLIGSNSEIFYCKGACWNPVTGVVYAALNFSERIMRFVGETGEVLPSVSVHDSPADMVSMDDTSLVFCAHNYNLEIHDRVSVIDADSLVASLVVPPTPIGLVASEPEKRVYVLSGYASTLAVVAYGPQAVAGENPSRLRRLDAGPNPFTGSVRLQLPAGGRGEVTVFDAAGRRVAVLSGSGGHVDWDSEGHAPGVYFARSGAEQVRLVKAR